MSDLVQLFTHLQGNRNYYLGATTGAQFEDRIKARLDSIGFNRAIQSDFTSAAMEQIKNDAGGHFHDEQINNPTNRRRHYLYQPFGSQAYPDFIVFDDNRLVCIEIKFSTGSTRKPVWNSGLPRQHGIYVFGSRGIPDITFFLGRGVLSEEEARKMHRFFDDDLRQLQHEFNASMDDQSYGFRVYVRKAFEQSRQSNQDAVLDFFNNPQRDTLEHSVINFLEAI